MHTYSTGFPIKNECCKFSGQNSNRNTYFHSQKSNFFMGTLYDNSPPELPFPGPVSWPACVSWPDSRMNRRLHHLKEQALSKLHSGKGYNEYKTAPSESPPAASPWRRRSTSTDGKMITQQYLAACHEPGHPGREQKLLVPHCSGYHLAHVGFTPLTLPF